MTLGNRIYKYRTEHGLSRESIAEKCSVSSQSVQKWESDSSKPSLENLIMLSKIFNITLDALAIGVDEGVREERKAFIHPDYSEERLWETYADFLMTEYNQSLEEGKDVEEYEKLFKAVSCLKNFEYKERLGDILFDIVTNATMRENYEFYEPSDLAEIKKSRDPSAMNKKEPNQSLLQSKIAGAWYGRICGCFLGKSIEGIKTDELNRLLKETGNYPMHRYIKKSEIPEDMLRRARFNFDHDHYADLIDCVPSDDDTNYTVLYQELITKYGRDFKPRDVAAFWTEKQPKSAYYTAEETAYCNFIKGFTPPASAMYKNPFREWIGAQIRADYFGYINSGDPETAADMAYRDAVISHTKNGIYGEMYFAALIAIAAVENDMREAIEQALKFIPQKSRFVRSVRLITDDYDGGVDESKCFSKILSRWDEYTYGCHVLPNAEIVIASLLYGDGDYGKTICRAVQTGLDTDCNAATAGSVLGMMTGISAIGEEWTSPFGGKLETQIFGVGKVNIGDRIDITFEHINR